MILEITDIQRILKEKPNAGLLLKAVEQSKELRTHIFGENIATKLPVIEGFEKETTRNLRVKYARTNKDLFARLMRPIDKVFSARGGSVYYNLGEEQERRAANIASNIKDGISLKKWMEMYWKTLSLSDPNSLTFIEIGNDGVPYPTFKAISTVFDYLPKGVELEYVIFNVSKSEKKAAGLKEDDTIYRVVDDLLDRYVKLDGDIITEIKDKTFLNYFSRVPAIINSDIVSTQTPGLYLSLFDEIISLANEFLIKGSIRVTHDFLHAFPKYWEFADDCPECKGTGFKEGEKICPSCNGSAKSTISKVSQVKQLNWPSKDDVNVAPNVAGYVTPPKDFYDISTQDLNLLEDYMTFTIWGTHKKQQPQAAGGNNQPVTATQAFIDVQPVNDRLATISEMAERRHKFIIDLIITLLINKSYKGASINYGRRYLIESPDAIWEKYSNARVKGAPIKVLNDFLIDFIEAKYNGDAINMHIQLKLINIEPFVHYSITQASTFTYAAPEDLQAKTYFGEWLTTINSGLLLTQNVEELRQSLTTYVSTKSFPEPQAKTLV